MDKNRNVTVEHVNIDEALRYLGYGDSRPDDVTKGLLLSCEELLLKEIDGKFIYRVFPLEKGQIPNSEFKLEGVAIQKHLENCSQVIFLCATISANVDKLIRRKQIGSMAEAMIIDSMASAAVEQVCNEAEQRILADFTEYEHTWRFGIGYGDFPLSKQKQFLEILDAPKRIGVCVNENMMLTPTKSVTCVIGLGHGLKNDKKKNCDVCNLRERCLYRKKGKSCGSKEDISK